MALWAGWCLLALGAGAINDIEDLVSLVVDELGRLSGAWRVFVTKNPIGVSGQRRQDVEEIARYPLAHLFPAFDFMVSAAGYNSVHEAVLAEVPTLWVPNLNTQTDDQAARAGFLAAQGAGLSLENPGPAELAEALAQMASADERGKMAQRCRELSFGNGAQAAADIIHQIITGEKP